MARTMLRRPKQTPEPAAAAEPETTTTPAPVARFKSGRVATARQRNLGWLLGGLLLVLLCALGGLLLLTSTDDREDAVVAATDLEAGEPVSRGDLRVVRVAVGPGISIVTPQEAADLIGQAPLGRIPAGAVLSAGMFSTSSPLAEGEVVFGAALDPGEAPLSRIELGASVKLVVARKTQAGGPEQSEDQAEPETAQVLGDGRVWAVEPLGTGQIWLTVRSQESVALAATQASQDDALRVVLAGG